MTDFGLAKKASQEGLKTFCGTPQYFAPEVNTVFYCLFCLIVYAAGMIHVECVWLIILKKCGVGS